MGLALYHKKRDFARTAEPKGRVHRSQKALHYCIQKHDASHLHYDFRLEYGGVLKSWAVPKGPSLDPTVRSLAIEVEDHPLEYGDFEGTIPKGEYGGGTVMLWDRGDWVPDGDAAEGLRKGKLSFELRGEKLRGHWTLVRIRAKGNERRVHWLLMKSGDEFARPGTRHLLLEEESRSVKTGRDLDEIAAGKKSKSRKAANKKPARSKPQEKSGRKAIQAADINPASLTNARRAAQPEWVPPQLATLVENPPSGGPWIYEVKFDGYRLIAIRRGTTVRLIIRNQKDWTDRFQPIAEAISKLPADRLILDGEVVVVNEHGKSSFQALQNVTQDGGRGGRLLYAVFDILNCKGYDITGAPLVERKRLLESLFKKATGGRTFISGPGRSGLQYSEHASGDGAAALKNVCAHGEEGLIFKRSDLPYVSRRTQGWLKVKCFHRREFVIGGYTDPKNTRTGFGALLLGFHTKDGSLRYCGRVGTGFNVTTLTDLHRRLAKLETPRPPFANPPVGADARGVHWVKPAIVAEVSFLAMTSDGILRHPTFEGLRMDKKASEVIDEVPADTAKAIPRASRESRQPRPGVSRRSRGASANSPEPTTVAGITLSHPDRVLFPESNITKLQLAEYYEAVADAMLPFIADRPLMLVRCPGGLGSDCFHQKHMNQQMPKSLRGVRITEKSKSGIYPLVDDAAGLISLVQMNTLEIHGWQSKAGDLERPDQVIFDLDPGEGVKWSEIADTALAIREILEHCGLHCFIKTSGGKGLHLVSPLKPAASWDEVKGFAQAVSSGVSRAAPDRYVEKMTKSIRRGKIYIDYLRNGRGATCVLPYSTRVHPGASVSMPIAWESVKKLASASQFTVENAPSRLKKSKNPWADFDAKRRPITKKTLKSVGAK